VYGVHHIFDLIEPSTSRSRGTEACSNGSRVKRPLTCGRTLYGGLLQLATVLGVCARCAFSIGGVDAETIPEREIWRRKIDRSGKRHLYLSMISSFRLTQMCISSNSCSLSLVISLGKQQTPPREASFSLHSPFLRPFCNIPFACSISSPLSLSLDTHQCKPRARRQASKDGRNRGSRIVAGAGPSVT
jgi:hypothetical protein